MAKRKKQSEFDRELALLLASGAEILTAENIGTIGTASDRARREELAEALAEGFAQAEAFDSAGRRQRDQPEPEPTA